MGLRWPAKASSTLPIGKANILSTPSLPPLTSSGSALRWRGYQLILITGPLWQATLAVDSPSLSQQTTLPSASPEARYIISGRKAKTITQALCLYRVLRGVDVLRSQILMVESPEPEASSLESGENCTQSTDSVWPKRESEERVIGRTRKRATGWYTTGRADSDGC